MGKAARSVLAALAVTVIVAVALFLHRMAGAPAPVDPGLSTPVLGSTALQVVPPPNGAAAIPQVAAGVSTFRWGTLLAISPDGISHWFRADDLYLLRHWNAASGDLRTIQWPPEQTIHSLSGAYAAVASGLLVVGGKAQESGRILFFDAVGGLRAGALQQPRAGALLVPLRDGSVLAIGGTTGDKPILSKAVDRITFASGTPTAKPLPDIPGLPRRRIAAVELADGRVMVLGGYTDQGPDSDAVRMTADTYLLDLSSETWQPGPRMLQARTGATATRLPDGSVLVVGGWTPGANAAERSTERWLPGSVAFVPDRPLAQGVAGHQAQWLPGREQTRLVVAGGWTSDEFNNSIQTLDVATGTWRLAGEGCSWPELPPAGMRPLHFFAAQAPGGDGVWCDRLSREWSRVELRPDAAGPDRGVTFYPELGIRLGRSGLAFLAQGPDSPALMIGGSLSSSYSAAVDAIWPNGRIAALPAMTHARRGAHVLRFADGSIFVAGGTDSGRTKAEILPGGERRTASRWIDLDLDLAPGTVFARLGESGAVAVAPDGAVELLAFTALETARPSVRRSPLPRMNRRSWRMGEVSAEVKVLPDGRIVVVGGEVQANRIAIVHNAVEDPAAPDRFRSYGPFTAARTHEIWDPATKAWRESAPSASAGGLAAVFDDGRVVKWGPLAGPDGYRKTILEISDVNGTTWRAFEGAEAQTVTADRVAHGARPFVIDGELLLSGYINDRWPETLQRFDPSLRRWVTLWQSSENHWRAHAGRVIVRELGPGRRVVLPVGGP